MKTRYEVKGILLTATISLVVLTALLTVPAASALTQRNNFDDNIYTSFYYGGSHRVCGDHLCSPGEYGQMMKHINDVQRGSAPPKTK